jgi:hypothetical protein
LVFASLVLYLNKAYTIDDPLFLFSARQILQSPLKPMSYPICWMGKETCVQHASNMGPLAAQALMGYLLVPVILAGGAEWMAHAMQILFACLAVIAMVRLALRLGCDRLQAAMAGMMLVAIPPFLVMANTAMPDILAIALGLTGFERLLAWKASRRPLDAAIASVALGLAPYARPHLILLLPFGALWMFDEFRLRSAIRQVRRRAWLWTPLLLAACILMVVTRLTHDRGVAVEAPDAMMGWGRVPKNLFAYFQYLAFPIPFAVVWIALNWRKAPMLLLALPLVPTLMFHFAVFPARSLFDEWPTAATMYGAAALLHMLSVYWGARDWTNRLLSLWILFPLPAVVYIHLPMKYMIGVMPAIILILLRNLWELGQPRALMISRALVLVCAALSWLYLGADRDFAEYGRRAAAELIAPRLAAGEKVWYGSGQWGFNWYAHESGAQVSKPGEPGPRSGELLVVGLVEGGSATLQRFPNRELVDALRYNSPHGRTMGHGAAFYSNSCGDAPWIWAPESTNDYEVWRIR